MLHLVLNVYIPFLFVVGNFAWEISYNWQELGEGQTSTQNKHLIYDAKKFNPTSAKQSVRKTKTKKDVLKRSLSYDNRIDQETGKIMSIREKVLVHNVVRRALNETNTASNERCSLTCIIIIASCGIALLIFCLVGSIYYATCKYTEEHFHDNWFGRKVTRKQSVTLRKPSHSYMDEKIKHFGKPQPNPNAEWVLGLDGKYTVDNSTFYLNGEEGVYDIYPNFGPTEIADDQFYQYHDVNPDYDFLPNKYNTTYSYDNDVFNYDEDIKRVSEFSEIYKYRTRTVGSNIKFRDRLMEINDRPRPVFKENVDELKSDRSIDEEDKATYNTTTVDVRARRPLKNKKVRRKTTYRDNLEPDKQNARSQNRMEKYEEIILESSRNHKHMERNSGNETDFSGNLSHTETDLNIEGDYDQNYLNRKKGRFKQRRQNFSSAISLNDRPSQMTDLYIITSDQSMKNQDRENNYISDISAEELSVESENDYNKKESLRSKSMSRPAYEQEIVPKQIEDNHAYQDDAYHSMDDVLSAEV